MNILVVGCGYVGLSVATLLRRKSIVRLWDIDKLKLEKIKNNIVPFSDDAMSKEWEISNKKFEILDSLKDSLKDVNTVFIAVPTDFIEVDNSLDTSNVERIMNDIAKYADKQFKKIRIVIKSTLPVGYTRYLIDKYGSENIYCMPEFLREGTSYYDISFPDRYIVGCKEKNNDITEIVDLFKSCSENHNCPVLYVSPTEAESIKLFSNTYLAMRIAFFNELDSFAELNDLNSRNIINGVCYDKRIGDSYNNPSFGYGGYCLPKDTKQLASSFRNIDNAIISSIDVSNEKRINHIVSEILKKDANIIGIYRLISKSNSDNFRQSVMIDIIQKLMDYGKEVLVYEPLDVSRENFIKLTLIRDLSEFLEKSDLIVANRVEKVLLGCGKKIYTRDLFNRN